MPRKARIVAPGYPHHITQRGNYKQTVFAEDADRKNYLKLMKIYTGKYGLKIWAYCLMNNHVHFIAVPSTVDSMSKTFSQVNKLYSEYFNKKMSGLVTYGRIAIFHVFLMRIISLRRSDMLRITRFVQAW